MKLGIDKHGDNVQDEQMHGLDRIPLARQMSCTEQACCLLLFDARQQAASVSAGPSTNAAADDEDDCMIVEPKNVKKAVTAKAVSAGVLSDANGKRKRVAADSGGPDKRIKKAQTDGDDVITLD